MSQLEYGTIIMELSYQLGLINWLERKQNRFFGFRE